MRYYVTLTKRLFAFSTTWAVLVLLSAVTIAAHFDWIRVGIGIVDSDSATEPLMAAQIRTGQFQAFTWNQVYGGITLKVVQAVWSAGTEPILKLANVADPGLIAYLIFAFLVVPLALAFTAYALAERYAGRVPGLLTALMVAVGFKFWASQYLNYTYIGYYIIGCLLLVWRGRFDSLWQQASPRSFLVAGVASGLGLYTSRALLLFLVPVFLPWDWLKREIAAWFAPRDRLEKALLGFGVVFLGLFLYLEIFGPELGVLFGKKIRVHASPNLNYGLFFLCLLELKHRWRDLLADRALLLRGSCLVLGAAIGMLPELIHWLRLGVLPPASPAGNAGFTELMSAVGMIPQSLRELVGNGAGLARQASLALALGGLVAMFRQARSDRRLQPIAILAVLAAYAYCRTVTYTFAPARYLLPIFPAILVGIACLWREAISRRSPLLIGCLSLLLLAHFAGQIIAHREQIAEIQVSGRIGRLQEVIQTVRDAAVPVVISDNYWESNTYTLMSGMNPPFAGPDIYALNPPQATHLALDAMTAGIFLKTTADWRTRTEVQMFGRKWSLSPLKEVGDRALYIGRAQTSSAGMHP